MNLNMNIDGKTAAMAQNIASLSQNGDCKTASTASRDASLLTVTESIASSEDISASSIPEEAFSRNDALGSLIGKAFNLPPPQFPRV